MDSNGFPVVTHSTLFHGLFSTALEFEGTGFTVKQVGRRL